jgi:hypothetical protein
MGRAQPQRVDVAIPGRDPVALQLVRRVAGRRLETAMTQGRDEPTGADYQAAFKQMPTDELINGLLALARDLQHKARLSEKERALGILVVVEAVSRLGPLADVTVVMTEPPD